MKTTVPAEIEVESVLITPGPLRGTSNMKVFCRVHPFGKPMHNTDPIVFYGPISDECLEGIFKEAQEVIKLTVSKEQAK